MSPVAVFVAYYVPGTRAGGPIRSVFNLVSALGDRFDFSILTLDHDFGHDDPYPGVTAYEWTQVGKARVKYLGTGWRAIRAIVAEAVGTDAKVILLNSVFERRFSMLPLWSRVIAGRALDPVVLAPRGELSEAGQRSKPRRKALYLAMLKACGIPQRITWMASSEYEKRDIERTFGRVRVRMAPPLPYCRQGQGWVASHAKESGRLRAVFVGRIVPHKGLHVALEALSRVRGRVRLEIAGPIEDEHYWDTCQRRIDELPHDVEYLGLLDRPALEAALGRAELFVLPTRSENFGHAIAEALAAGVPLLISDATPWRGLFDRGVGWDLPLADEQAFADALQAAVDMGTEDHAAMRDRAAAFVTEVAGDPRLIEANATLLDEVANTARSMNDAVRSITQHGETTETS